MADYLHGAYGQIQSAGSRVSTVSKNVFVYIGTAPVHTVEGGAERVNKPILVSSIADARRKLGYSDDFASYTLCEAMNAHLNLNGVGPLVFINVLDPNTHVSKTEGTKNLTPEKGRVTITAAENIILDTVAVKSGEGTKVKGEDYGIAYNADKKAITISEAKPGSLGSAALTITYKEIDPSAVTAEEVIGETDGCGLNSGIYAAENVFQETGYIPSFLVAPGFSCVPKIHDVMVNVAKKINGHWSAYVLADIPISDADGEITLATAKEWKDDNGYTNDNETVYFPMAEGSDGHKYHLATLAAANLQTLLAAQEGIPYRTASNTESAIIQNLYLGEGYGGRVYDDTMINERLCKNGIASAAFVGGKWVIWGAHSASYDQEHADDRNVSETNYMMLYYIINDFQYRRSRNVDKPMTMNDLQAIEAEEQAKLDALVNIHALSFGRVRLNGEKEFASDALKGDFSFTFDISTTPLVKSLTGLAVWNGNGFITYFESFTQK